MNAPKQRDELIQLLREAVKIVHCHARNTDKEWLRRARAVLRELKSGSEVA